MLYFGKSTKYTYNLVQKISMRLNFQRFTQDRLSKEYLREIKIIILILKKYVDDMKFFFF